MSNQQTALIILICGLFLLLFCEKFRHDTTALIILVIAIMLGVVPINNAFNGFNHPATLTVFIVLTISKALSNIGATASISNIIPKTINNDRMIILVTGAISGILSMFINNIAALALMMPITIDLATKLKKPPSRFLIPLSFCSILGGMTTLIGTPPNIIVSSYREKYLGVGYDLFDFSYTGGLIFLVGIIFIALIGYKLVPIRKSSTENELFNIESYLAEVKITKNSLIRGKTINEAENLMKKIDVNFISLIRKKTKYTVIPKKLQFITNDIIIIEGSQSEIDKLTTKLKLNLNISGTLSHEILHSNDAETIEVAVQTNSSTIGKTVKNIGFKRKHRINLLAISRSGALYKNRIGNNIIKAGDILLLHGDKNELVESISKLDLIPLAKRNLFFGKSRYVYTSLSMFFIAIALSALNIIPIYIAFLGVLLIMLATKIVREKDIYRGTDYSVAILIAALIPIGQAIEHTGTSQLIVEYLLNNLLITNPTILLLLTLILTMTISDLLNNTATAIIMCPLAVSIAKLSFANPDSFLMAVAIGSSCAFLTPIGHQNNMLILNAGGYKFSDFWKIGLLIQIIIIIIAIPLIYYFWPINNII